MHVAIADDSALFRSGLALLLEAAGIQVSLQARSGTELVAQLGQPKRPPVDAVIVDIRMPPSFTDEGIVTAHEVRRLSSTMGVLVLSTYVETAYAVRLMAEGSAGLGYLLKDHVDEIDSLREALERVVAGESVIDPEIVRRLLRPQGRVAAEHLTERERAVLSLMAEGRSNAGIAARMQVSLKTVEGHVRNIFTRLGLESDADDNRRVLAVLSWLRTLEDT
jgi:DNA-binding NarL/FixJ family response regulator